MRERASLLFACLLLAQATVTFGQYESPVSAPQQVVASPATQSPEPAIDCAGHADGLYVRSPNECNDGFYKCANNRSFYYRCPTGLFFSIEDAQCEYRQLIPACGGQRPVATTAQVPVAPVQNQGYQNPASTYSQPAQQPVFIQQTQAPPVYQAQQPVFVQQTQAPQSYQTPAPQFFVQPTTQAPTPVFVQQPNQPAQPMVPSYHISYAQQPSAPIASSQQYSQQQAPQLVTNTQPPADFNCGSNPDGYYYKQQCTSTYYSCIGGLASKLQCPQGTVYDPSVHACDYSGVCGQPRQPSTTTQQPMVNYGYGWQAATTQAPSTECVGKMDGFYARGHCVPRYLHCSNGLSFDLACPAGLVFRNDACTFLSDCLSPTTPTPIALQTPAMPTPPPLTWCRDNNKGSGYFAAQMCSSTYYSCNGGFTTQLTCPANLAYDQNTQACEERQFSLACGGRPRPITTTTVAAPVKPVNFNCANKPTGYYTNVACSSVYYHCNGGFASELTCPANLMYDQSINACEQRQYVIACGGHPRPITTTPLPAPAAPAVNFNCATNPTGYYSKGCSATYYFCNAGFATEQHCPANLMYDQTINACEERQYVRACGGSPRPPTTTTIATPVKPVNFNCANKPTGYYSATGCSQSYYHCNGGFATEQLCPANLVYDQSTNICEERQFIQAHPVNFNCAGKNDGYYSTGCTTLYYSCNGGTAIEFTCPPGTNYSPQLHACDYRSNVPECGGQLPTTTQTAQIAVASGNSNYGYAPAPQSQAPVFVQPTTQAPVYQQPQTQAPVLVQQPQTQAPVYQQPQTQAPVFVQPTTTQAPVYQAPVYVQPPMDSPVYQPPVLVQQTTQSPAPAYQQQSQQFNAQAPTAPMALVQQQTDDSANQCSNLQNGIYGRRCSRHYFVCTDHKIFEFTCPSGYAYDRTIARCGPVQQIQGCGSMPDTQSNLTQPQARYLRYRK